LEEGLPPRAFVVFEEDARVFFCLATVQIYLERQ
jgi:hypothetical protein